MSSFIGFIFSFESVEKRIHIMGLGGILGYTGKIVVE
jgi:hypothetical protein